MSSTIHSFELKLSTTLYEISYNYLSQILIFKQMNLDCAQASLLYQSILYPVHKTTILNLFTADNCLILKCIRNKDKTQIYVLLFMFCICKMRQYQN